MGSPLPQGAPIAPEMKYCADCGKQIPRVADFCPHCGCRQPAPPQKESSGIFGLVGRGLGSIVGAVGQYMGWKKAKFLFWLLMAFLALRGTVLFLQEWADDCDLGRAIHRFQDFGIWLIPCALLLIGYIRWANKANRNWLGWIVFPMAAMAILCTLGGAQWEVACIAREDAIAQRERQAMAAEAQQQAPRLPPELERMPVANWVQVKVYLPKSDYITKLSSCKPSFRCETQSGWVIGPNLAVDKTRITNETESHRPMYIEQQYETFSDNEKAAVQAFCKAGFNIFQDVPMHKNMYGDFPDPNADRSQAVSVCVVTPPPKPNSTAETGLDRRMHWGMSKELVKQIEDANEPMALLAPNEVGPDYLIYRYDSAHTSSRTCYYFTDGKLVEIREDVEGVSMPAESNSKLNDLTKEFGQPVNLDVEFRPVKEDQGLNFQPVKSVTFASPTDVIVFVSYGDEMGVGPYSVISLDRSQPQLVAR